MRNNIELWRYFQKQISKSEKSLVMKLIIVCVFYPPLKSSAAIQIKDLESELLKQGHTISIITSNNLIKDQINIQKNKKLRIYRFKTGKLTDIPFIPRTINELITPFKIIFIILTRSVKLINHDGVIWWSPSIFLSPLILFLKLRNMCPSYLILRDLFPKWAKDLNLINNSFIYHIFNIFFLFQLYIADIVGIQSKSNQKFLPKKILHKKINVKLLNNWYSPVIKTQKTKINLNKTILRSKKVFVYAGNIGLAQNVETLVNLAERLKDEKEIGFLFIGRGRQYEFIRNLANKKRLKNILFHKQIPNNQLEELYKQCCGGLVILDQKHKTHNVPGKLLSYLFSGLPVFALLNSKHDLISFINNNNIGFATDFYDIDFLKIKIKEFSQIIKKDKYINSRCKKLANENFNTASIAKKITESLKKVSTK